jgi:tetratricopeptide (TPR) repeat protein
MQNEFNTAIQHHQSGRLQQAAQLYQTILGRYPNHADSLHLLGVVALQLGNPQKAIELIGRAIAINPGAAAFHCNLAEAHRALGQLERAVACCQLALRLQPNYPEAANNYGLALLAQGRSDAAIAQFRDALRLRPGIAMVHNNLGNALRIQGDKAQAVAEFREAIRLDPNLAEGHSNLGQLLLEMHQPDDALVHCRAAVRLRPNFPEAHNNLGNVLREIGQLAEAKACYNEALRLNPQLAMTYNNMGQALQEESKVEDAIAWYHQGLQRDPGSARIHCNLAGALEEQEKHAEAITRYEISLGLDPNYAEAHNGLGFVLHEQGEYEKAKAKYQEAIRHKPDFAPAHCNLGNVLEELGEFEPALERFREALRHEPEQPAALAQMATMLRGKLPEADLDAMRKLLTNPRLSANKKAALRFGLAQVLDAKGVYAEAAEHLREANAQTLLEWQKRGKAYNPPEHTQFIEEVLATFTPEYFERMHGLGLGTERPVFIVGLPRSGTTLTEQILASHSKAFGAGELRLVREDFEWLPTAMDRPQASSMDCVRALDRAAVERVAGRHLKQLRERHPDALRVADKMPDNYMYLGMIATLFPKAKLVHCRRDLRDIAVSCWMTNFRHIPWSNSPEHIASRFHEYQRVMEHWQKVLPVPVLEVGYEETVEDLEGVARRLIAWCGLDWEPACLAFHETRRPVRTASVTQVRQPIYKRSVARWKHYEESMGGLFAQL